ncbi:MAG: AAA family ATPase, partial [Planctomycetota bacterium]
TLAETLGLSFRRIQFTPDLMPADITGTEIIQENRSTGEREYRFVRGPVFANIVLADEINRTPPKTQSALLEAMQEHQVTVGGERYPLPEPFFVLATQNPIEQEGTYPLPEAQLDRFMLQILVDYPDEEEEFAIVKRTTAVMEEPVEPVVTAVELQEMLRLVRNVPADDSVIRFATRLVRLSRPRDSRAPEFIRQYVAWGAGPRASQFLVLGAKARAALLGEPHARIEDVKRVARPVLRHRLITNFNADADEVRSDDLIERLLELVSEEFDGDVSGPVSQVLKPTGA